MSSREFNKRISIYSIKPVPDGFGGSTTSETLLSDSWAKIESISPGKSKSLAEFGIDDPQNSVQITVRKRKDLVYDAEIHFFKYSGQDYKIASAPTDTNFEGRFITFIGSKVSNSEITAAP